jgi:beta-N-acetylhexosaminidase
MPPEQLAQLTNDLQTYAQDVGPDVPLLIAVDEEGGRVSRLQDGFTIFPPAVVLGATGSTDDAVSLGYAMGQELAAVGIKWTSRRSPSARSRKRQANGGDIRAR